LDGVSCPQMDWFTLRRSTEHISNVSTQSLVRLPKYRLSHLSTSMPIVRSLQWKTLDADTIPRGNPNARPPGIPLDAPCRSCMTTWTLSQTLAAICVHNSLPQYLYTSHSWTDSAGPIALAGLVAAPHSQPVLTHMHPQSDSSPCHCQTSLCL